MANTKSFFAKMLSASDTKIIAKRASVIEERTKRASEKAIRDIEDVILDLESKKLELENFERTHSDSLNPVSESFDASTFINRINEYDNKIKVKNIHLATAKANHEKYFG